MDVLNTFKTLWPQKISIFKKHFTAKITLILMIKKMPLAFLDVEKYLWSILCLYFWGLEEMSGNNFWSRSHLNKLDRLTPQDV